MKDIIEMLKELVQEMGDCHENSDCGIILDIPDAKEIIAFYEIHKECETSQILKPFIKQ